MKSPQESSSQSTRVLQSDLKSPPVSPQDSSSQSTSSLPVSPQESSSQSTSSPPVSPQVENIEKEKEGYLEQLDCYKEWMDGEIAHLFNSPAPVGKEKE